MAEAGWHQYSLPSMMTYGITPIVHLSLAFDQTLPWIQGTRILTPLPI